ncbi:unnamed protein product [Heterobilharzia americana]|nr:unnamed protein product [Heterobilharzia americana]
MKSILKNKGSLGHVQKIEVQRSSSLDTEGQAGKSVDKVDDGELREVEKPESFKKRALICDEQRVCRPGELDDSNTEENHGSRLSVVDRTAAERISYRLIQQRSLDFGLYRKLNNFNIDSSSSSLTHSQDKILEHGDDIEKLYDKNPNDSNDCILHQSNASTETENTNGCDNNDMSSPHIDSLYSQESEVEEAKSFIKDEVYENSKLLELGKEFTLKDILAHRVPELEVDSSCMDDDDVSMHTYQDSISK